MAYREFGGPGVTVRTLGQQTAQAQPLESYFSDIPNADAPTPKPGQKPLVDYFKDIGVPETGPVDPNQVVKPPTMKDADIFKPEEGVDYETGAPMGHRMNLYRASAAPGPDNTKTEQELYLEKTFGAGNYRKDAGGQWLVKPNWDKRNDRTAVAGSKPEGAPVLHDQKTAPWTSVFPRTSMAGMVENAGVGLAAAVPTMAGALGGAAAGTPGGPIGMAAGAGIGAGAGHLVDEGLKQLQGFYNKDPATVAKDTALEGVMNATFQGAPWLWNASRRHVLNLSAATFGRVGGVTQEGRDIVHSLEPYGVTPPMEGIAPRFKWLGYDRNQRNKTSGDPMLAERRAVVDERIGEVLDNIGFQPNQRVDAMHYINDIHAGPQTGRTGQIVQDAMTARDTLSQHVQDAYIENARRAIDRAFDTYTRSINRPVLTKPGTDFVTSQGNLARGLSTTMEDARAEFGREFNVVYNDFHNVMGGRAVIDGTGIVEGLKDLVHATPAPVRNVLGKAEARMTPADIPDDVAPHVAADDIQSIMDAIASRLQGPPASSGVGAAAANDNPVMLTIQEAHKLRSALVEMVRLRGDTSPMGSRRGEIYHIVGQIDAAMDQVALDAGGTVGSTMREANARYAEGVVRFTNDDINQVLRQTRAGRPPDPGIVADAIMNRKSLTATKQIYDMLSPDMQFAVQQADLQNIINSATIPVGRFGRPSLDPDALLDALAERSSLHRFMYGRDNPLFRELRELAVNTKVLGGDIDINALAAGSTRQSNVVSFPQMGPGVTNSSRDIRDSLRAAHAEQQWREAEVRRDTMASLRSTDPQLVAQGARYILKDEARTLRAAELLGPTSPEWQALRREAIVETLRNAIVPTVAGVGRTVNGRALENAMAGLTARQQRMLFDGAAYDDIRLLAQQARTLFPELSQDPGGSLAAAATLGNLPKANAIRRMLWSRVAGFIADSPALARALAGTIRQDPYRGRRLMGYMMQYGANVFDARLNQSGGAPAPGSEPSFDEQMRQLEAVHKPVKKQGYGGSDF